MKIVLAHNTYQQPGGEDVVFEQERQMLKSAGHDVIVYRRSNHEIDELSALERLALVKRTILAADTQREFAQLLARETPDLVHVHNTFLMISPSVYRACREHRIPVVQTLHNFRLLCPAATLFRDGKICEDCVEHTLWRGVYHGCYRESRPATAGVALMLAYHRQVGTWNKLVDCYIALTEFARNKFIAAGLSADKIVVKPNFVDPDPGPRERVGENALFIGRLSLEKGVSTLLQAWQHLPKDFTLQIIGDGPERERLEAKVRELHLSTITFRGHLSREETIAALKSARFLVVPSLWYEGFPMSIAESFACATPVICSRLGGMKEIVDDNRTGIHFTPGDAKDMAQKVEWSWNHPSDLAAIGRAGRREYEAKFTADQNYSVLMNIYNRTVATYSCPHSSEKLVCLSLR